MSNEVFTREEISLQDGTDVELRPLTIGKKKKFMRVWSDHITHVNKTLMEAQAAAEKAKEDETEPEFTFDENKMTEKQYEVYVKMCIMCLDEIRNDRTDKQFADYLENVLDDPTIFKILNTCGGLNLGESPN